MSQPICFYLKYGHCKKRNYCKNIHYPQICEEVSFEIAKCEKRHPKECNYYNQYQKCNFSNCLYRHVRLPRNKDFQELSKRDSAFEL